MKKKTRNILLATLIPATILSVATPCVTFAVLDNTGEIRIGFDETEKNTSDILPLFFWDMALVTAKGYADEKTVEISFGHHTDLDEHLHKDKYDYDPTTEVRLSVYRMLLTIIEPKYPEQFDTTYLNKYRIYSCTGTIDHFFGKEYDYEKSNGETIFPKAITDVLTKDDFDKDVEQHVSYFIDLESLDGSNLPLYDSNDYVPSYGHTNSVTCKYSDLFGIKFVPTK